MKKQKRATGKTLFALSTMSDSTDLIRRNYRLASNLNDVKANLTVTSGKLSRVSMRLISTQSQLRVSRNEVKNLSSDLLVSNLAIVNLESKLAQSEEYVFKVSLVL